jgi:dTDP-4-dehydrorhamnose 3,5-epimerase
MIFTETPLNGAFFIHPERIEDARGFFARSWCEREFQAHGIHVAWVQCNISFNTAIGTLRGMHFQAAPYEEAKLIRCTMGAIYDVLVDLRRDSTTYRQWVAAELNAQNRAMVFAPAGVAHGFLSLTASSEVFYMMSERYVPGCSRGVRWNDPALAIAWPSEVRVISRQDMSWPDWSL